LLLSRHFWSWALDKFSGLNRTQAGSQMPKYVRRAVFWYSVCDLKLRTQLPQSRKLLTRKNIRRKFPTKFRFSFQLYFRKSTSLACARRFSAPPLPFSRQRKRRWKASTPAGTRDNPARARRTLRSHELRARSRFLHLRNPTHSGTARAPVIRLLLWQESRVALRLSHRAR